MADPREEEKNLTVANPSQPQVAPPERFFPYETAEERVDIRDYFSVILRRRWIIIAFLVTVVTTVTIGTFLKKPTYKATVTIKIEKENSNILAFKDVVGLERTEDDYYQTQYKVLKSRNLAKRVIRSVGLNTNPEFVPALKNATAGAESSMLSKQVIPLEDDGISQTLVDSFIGRIQISPLAKSRLVNVSFVSYDPELSATVANAIAESFIGLNIDSKFEATHQASAWLQKQLDIMKAKVEEAEEKLNEYAAKNEIIFLEKDNAGKGSETENIIMKKLSELSTELTAATSERINKEALYKEMNSGDSEASSVVINNPLIMELKKTYASLDAEYNEQLKIYKPDYPKMVKLKEHVSQIKKKLEQETKKIVSSIRKDFAVTVSREKQLKTTFDAQKNLALDLNQRAVQYHILKREADTNKELYNGLLQRLKETGVSASLTPSNIHVLDRAEVPLKPFKPNKTLNIALSLIVGLLGGVGIAFFTEYLDSTIKTPDDIEKRVALPLLGYIPTHTNTENLPVEFISHADNDSLITEAYRSLRTFLLLSTGGTPPKVMMVTSPGRDEGKTTTTVNTAISLAKSGAKVLIIDADMRKPRIHRIFGLENIRGLSVFLSGNAGLTDGLMQTSSIENLDILASGPVPPNPAELLNSYRFQELLSGLHPLYNFIVIDTPPVLGIADPLIISQSTDGVIMVLKSEATPKEAAREAKRLLRSVHAKILGVVLNSISQSTMKYNYGYGYGYGYYKHYSDNQDA